jgi:hypothetical protein
MPEPSNGNNTIRITNRELYDTIQVLSNDVRDIKSGMETYKTDNRDLRTRVRALELRFYGILAGLVGAIIILLRVSTGGKAF